MAALIFFVTGLVRGIGRGIHSFHPARKNRSHPLAGAGTSVPSVPYVGRVASAASPLAPHNRRGWGGREGLRVFREGWAGLWGGFVPFVFLLLYPALTLAQPDLQVAGRIAPPAPGESA